MKRAEFLWCIAGGYAVELLVGRAFREHGDTDIMVLRQDQLALQSWLLDRDHGSGLLLLVETYRRECDQSAARQTSEDGGTRGLLAEDFGEIVSGASHQPAQFGHAHERSRPSHVSIRQRRPNTSIIGFVIRHDRPPFRRNGFLIRACRDGTGFLEQRHPIRGPTVLRHSDRTGRTYPDTSVSSCSSI